MSQGVGVWPEERLREELEAAGGRAEWEIGPLLRAFGARRPTSRARRNMERALREAGVGVEPSNGDTSSVTLFLLEQAPGEAATDRAVPRLEGPSPAADTPPGRAGANGSGSLAAGGAAGQGAAGAPASPDPLAVAEGAARPDRGLASRRAVEIVAERPGIGQRELAERLRDETGVGLSSAVAIIRLLERDGQLGSYREGRRKAYEPAGLATRPGRALLPTGGAGARPRRRAGGGALVDGVRAGDRDAMADFYDRRAAAVFAYCSRLCAPELIADGVEAAFDALFETVRRSPEMEDADLDAILLRATRAAAAERAAPPPPARRAARRRRRRGDSRASGHDHMPSLLAARASGILPASDTERMERHLRRCEACRAAALRFDEAERAFEALREGAPPATVHSSLLGASGPAVAEMPAPEVEVLDWQPAPAEEARDQRGPDMAAAPAPEVEAPARVEPVVEAPSAVEPAVEAPSAVEPAVEATTPLEPALEAPPAAPEEETAPAKPPRPPLSRARRIASAALFVIGVLLLSEAAVTVLWKEPFSAIYAARAQDRVSKELDQLVEREARGIDLLASERRALARAQRIRNRRRRIAKRMELLAESLNGRLAPGKPLGRMKIDRLDLNVVVLQATTDASLRQGPAHYRETRLPGERGTVGIAAHRTTYSAPFRKINQLKRGDRVVFTMPYGRFTYTVEGSKIVPAGTTELLRPVDHDRLALTACHPLYSASQRIIVFAGLTRVEPRGQALLNERRPGRRRRGRPAAPRPQRIRLGSRSLSLGDRGPDVRAVQRLLGVRQTGLFGPATAAAVSRFQRRNDLPVVGRVGPQTRKALLRLARSRSRDSGRR